ncbi:MAG: hypothetical protein JW892_07930, partial [Anaerolineae bacterium]|nr:hypothetical protein [Anaerolineae bacterium]
MPSALYLAPAAGGKTAYLVTRARALAQGLRVTPRIVVPTQLQARAWKQRLAEAGGAMGVRVGTFDTLYRDILDATGETIIHLSEPVQYRLLRTIIANTDLSHYASLRAMPGFVQAVQTLIQELKAGGIEPEAFATAVASMGNEPRLAELARLYFVYQNQLQAHNWADSSGTGWLAAESLARHHAVGRDWPALFVDGFDDLTTVQQRVLQELAPRVGEFIITLTGAPGVQARELVHKRFSRTQQSLENDLGLHPKPLPNNTGPTQAPELAHLASTFLANAETVSLPAGKALTLIAAADREGEVRAALRWLKQRCVHDGLRLGEVALLARNCTPYRPFILQIAAEFGMPVHVVAGLPLRQNPAVTALLDLLRLILPEAPL